jgi:hypothetical protein
MSWVGGYPLAGFEVTIIGRFWVTAEEHEDNDVGKPAHINTIALVIHMRIR